MRHARRTRLDAIDQNPIGGGTMTTRSKEEWPHVALRSKRWSAIPTWEESAESPLSGAAWTRWSLIGIVFAVAAITLVSGIALAALHQADPDAMKQRPSPAKTSPSCAASDAHLQELLREHRRVVFGSH
jgi:hypothetical protein